MQKILRFFRNEFVLSSAITLLFVLTIFFPEKIPEFPRYVDWRTIFTLTGLIAITTGLSQSNYFCRLSCRMLKKFNTERKLALFLMLFSALLATFLTNDVTLFVVLPITISIQRNLENDLSKLIIFEAIAVNVGSSLTPIGNPQNVFLWHQWDIHFFTFVFKLLPLFAVLTVTLIIFALATFKNKPIRFSVPQKVQIDERLLKLSLILLISYILAIETGIEEVILPIILLLYLLLYRQVLKEMDWILLILFVLIFIDFHLLSLSPFVVKFVNGLQIHTGKDVFLFSALVSQIISNVPASVFVSKFSHDWFAITYGVNVGGNGLVIGSLANIIALRAAKDRRIWLKFHLYSIPYFILTLLLILFLIF